MRKPKAEEEQEGQLEESFSPLAGIRYAETQILALGIFCIFIVVSVPLRGLDMRKPPKLPHRFLYHQ